MSNVSKKSPGLSINRAVSTSSHLNFCLCKCGLTCLRSNTNLFLSLFRVATERGLTTIGGVPTVVMLWQANDSEITWVTKAWLSRADLLFLKITGLGNVDKGRI